MRCNSSGSRKGFPYVFRTECRPARKDEFMKINPSFRLLDLVPFGVLFALWVQAEAPPPVPSADRVRPSIVVLGALPFELTDSITLFAGERPSAFETTEGSEGSRTRVRYDRIQSDWFSWVKHSVSGKQFNLNLFEGTSYLVVLRGMQIIGSAMVYRG